MYTLFITTLLLLPSCFCYNYDATDFEIFDLFEEVNGTFYELLSIEQDATVKEIRRAYRKKTMEYHPDKNTAADSEEKFRQLVAVYEVLKDKDKRERYHEVLKNGLPTWRQPMYYYRKYRKMGTLELSIIISIIATIGHYLTWLVAYWEKKLEMEEILEPLRKRQEKKKAKGKLNEGAEKLDTDTILEKELGYRKPTFWDLLPFVIYRWVVATIRSLPTRIKEGIRKRREAKEKKLKEIEEEKEAEEEAAKAKEKFEAEKLARAKRAKEKQVLRDASEFENETAILVASGYNAEEWKTDRSLKVIAQRKNEEWSESDYAALAKAMAKYPGGTPGRWDRIGHELGRRPDEVTKKVKEMKSAIATNLPEASGAIIKKKHVVNLSDALITKTINSELKKTSIINDSDLYQSQYDIPDDYDEGIACDSEEEEDYTVVKKKIKTRPVEEIPQESTGDEVSMDVWSQVQQKCLEAAISQFPKSTADRWTCIARAVPDKTKEQCITRFKLLAEHVKQRKSKQGS